MNEQACHAGPRALVTPMKRPLSKGSALISTCLFTSRNRAQAWKAARTRGLELGLDLKQLRAAFDQLPVLPKHKLEQVRSILAAATEIMSEVKSRFDAEEKLASRQSENTPVLQLQAALVHEVGVDTESAQANPIRTPCNMDHQQGPALIRAVANLIASKPEAPYSAAAIAAAARITPNHFSALFHRWTGKGFLEFLTTHRIRAAQTLLQNLSLTINEVARRAGFEDANYFARRFKQATGLTPREWRNALPVKGTRNRKAATSQAWLTVQSVACT
jgi:AraC-like DNA-binding protein